MPSINSDRLVNISSASQGGYSARVLPAPTPYSSSDEIIVYTDGSSLLVASDVGASIVNPRPSPPIAATGGPFGEPYIQGSSTVEWEYFSLESLAPAGQPFTLETWYRDSNVLPGEFTDVPRILRMEGDYNPELVNVPRSWAEMYRDRANATVNVYHGDESNAIERRKGAAGGSWRHAAIVQDSNGLRGYEDGALISTVWYGTDPGAISFPLGAFAAYAMQNDIGQVRYTHSAALYTGSVYTPPASLFIPVA